jgi:hypothetical protein
MKKLIFAAICSVTVFAGYGIEVGTEAVERGGSDSPYATENSGSSTKHAPPSSDQSEQESSAADAQILLVGTLLALAIVADAIPVQNDARHRSIP